MKFLFLYFIALISTQLTAQLTDSIAIKQVDSLIKVSRDLTAKNNFDKALEVNSVAEKIAFEKLGMESAAYGSTCFNHGRIFFFKRDYPEAEKWYLKSKAIWEKALGKDHPDYAWSMNNLANLYRDLSQYEKAEPLYLESIAIREKVLGKEHPDYAASLYNLAILYIYLGNYEKAKNILLESIAIREKVLGKEHPQYASSLNTLGNLYLEMDQYEKAEPLHLEAKDIRKKVLGKEHPDYASSLHNLANLYSDLGNYEKAEPLYLEAKTIREKVLGKEHPDYADGLNCLAILYSDLGNYEKAEPLYLETKDIRKKALGKEHPNYAMSLGNLANLYANMGNYEKAETHYLEAKDILGKALGKKHPNYASSLNNLAVNYYYKGDYEKAEPLYLEAKTIQENLLGKDHPDYASSLGNLANLYKYLGNYEKAEPLYFEAITIREKVLGKEHPDYAQSLNNLAIHYQNLGQYEKAESFYLEAKDIQGKALGKEHPDYAWSLNNLVDLYERQSRFLEVETLLLEALTRSQARMVNATTFLSEQELTKYTFTFQKSGNKLIAFIMARQAIEAQHGTLPNLAFDHALFYKGFLLTAATQLNTIAEGTPESKEISIRLKSYHRRLAAEYAKPIAGRKNVAELEEKANTAEKELARSIVGYAEAKRQVKWEEVMSALKKDEAAIEFVSFKVNFPKATDSIMYAALLLKPGTKQPIFIPLFEEKSLDSLLHSKSEIKEENVNNLYSLVTRGATPLEMSKKSLYESLYEMIWKPLEKELKGIRTIYFSPSGMLHQINQDAIPISKTARLSDKYKLIELNSTRQLVIPTQVKIANNDAVLYGGIQYEQDSTIKINEHLLASRSRGTLSFTQTDSTLRGGSWIYLAGTESEVNAIEKIMQNSGVQTKLKKGYSATEESFKNIGVNNTPSPRILHIATHGYFFPDRTSSAKSRMTYDPDSIGTASDPDKRSGAKAASTNLKILQSESEPVFKISEHPMLRSGLIMAGGNATWQGKQTLEGREDGVLTAYEISQMNLSNTELVVLSACETGLGDIQGSEGVYGLQRAFKIAGAKYLIMSLWQVPDKQTSLLMTTFYKKWLENKMTIPDAFHAAQKELRDNGLDPYHWAGFVLVE